MSIATECKKHLPLMQRDFSRFSVFCLFFLYYQCRWWNPQISHDWKEIAWHVFCKLVDYLPLWWTSLYAYFWRTELDETDPFILTCVLWTSLLFFDHFTTTNCGFNVLRGLTKSSLSICLSNSLTFPLFCCKLPKLLWNMLLKKIQSKHIYLQRWMVLRW